MKSSPAFQFYPSDFLASTSVMTEVQVGVYIRLLAWSWINGPLPLDDRQIQRVAGFFGPDWSEVWLAVCERWTQTPDGWVNSRLERTRKEQAEYRAIQAENGRKGGLKRSERASETQAPLKQSLSQRLSDGGSVGVSVGGSEQPSDFQAKSKPSVFDLRSSSLTSSLPLPSASHTPRARGAAPTAIMSGSHPSCDHAMFGACAKGLCVPKFVYQPWRVQLQHLAGDEADRYLSEFVEAVVGKLTGPVGDDTPTFWRKQWGARHGVLPWPQAQKQSNGDALLANVRKAAEAIAAKEGKSRVF